MRVLFTVAFVSLLAGALFLYDGVSNWPSGSLLEIDWDAFENALLSTYIGTALIIIGILASLFALHARAVGQLTRAALAAQSAEDRARADEELARARAYQLRSDHRS